MPSVHRLKDPQDQRGFRDALISLGYTVRTKILKNTMMTRPVATAKSKFRH